MIDQLNKLQLPAAIVLAAGIGAVAWVCVRAPLLVFLVGVLALIAWGMS